MIRVIRWLVFHKATEKYYFSATARVLFYIDLVADRKAFGEESDHFPEKIHLKTFET
jgi:hypothetical protein